MARQRLGVVLLLPEPLATQVDGLRRALGDGALGRIPPHITLVPPVNVPERELPAAFGVVRLAAAPRRPISVQLGPVATFVPVNPVAFLAVDGDETELDALTQLRASCLSGPFDRPQVHEFVPHVTIADELSAPRLDVVEEVLGDFRAEVTFDRVHVLCEQPGRVWVPIADAPLGGAVATLGRGSLPLDLHVSGRPDLEAASLLALDAEAAGRPFAVTARRDGAVIAAVWGWTAGGCLEVADLVVAGAHRGQGVGRHLLAAVEELGRSRACRQAGAWAPADGASASLLQGCGWHLLTRADPGRGGRRRWERVLASDPE